MKQCACRPNLTSTIGHSHMGVDHILQLTQKKKKTVSQHKYICLDSLCPRLLHAHHLLLCVCSQDMCDPDLTEIPAIFGTSPPSEKSGIYSICGHFFIITSFSWWLSSVFSLCVSWSLLHLFWGRKQASSYYSTKSFYDFFFLSCVWIYISLTTVLLYIVSRFLCMLSRWLVLTLFQIINRLRFSMHQDT